MGLSARELDQLAYLSALAAQGITGDRIPLASQLTDEILPAKIEGDIREEEAKKAKKMKKGRLIGDLLGGIGGSFIGTRISGEPFQIDDAFRGVGNSVSKLGMVMGGGAGAGSEIGGALLGGIGSSVGGSFGGGDAPAFNPEAAAYMKGSSLPGPEPLTSSKAISPNAFASKVKNFSSKYPQLTNAAATAARNNAPAIGARAGGALGARFGSNAPSDPNFGTDPNYRSQKPTTVGQEQGARRGSKIGGFLQEYGPRIVSGLSQAFGEGDEEESAALPSFGNTLGLKPQQIATMSGEFREDARAVADRKMKKKEMMVRHQEHLDELKQEVALAKERAKLESGIAELRETGEWARHGQDMQNRLDILKEEMTNAGLNRTSAEGISREDNETSRANNAASVRATRENSAAIREQNTSQDKMRILQQLANSFDVKVYGGIDERTAYFSTIEAAQNLGLISGPELDRMIKQGNADYGTSSIAPPGVDPGAAGLPKAKTPGAAQVYRDANGNVVVGQPPRRKRNSNPFLIQLDNEGQWNPGF